MATEIQFSSCLLKVQCVAVGEVRYVADKKGSIQLGQISFKGYVQGMHISIS